VKVMERETWKEVIQLGDKEGPQVPFFFSFFLLFLSHSHLTLLKPISVIAFSPNGLYLAAADLAGTVFVWQFPSGTLVHR